MKRKGVIIAAVAAAVLLIIVVLIPVIFDANRFRPMVETQLHNALGRDASIGNLKLSILSGGVTAETLLISDDPAFSRKPFLTAKSVDVGLDLMGLIFSRKIDIHSLTLQQPEVTLLRSPSGKWNFSSLGPAKGGEKTAKKAPAEPAPSSSGGGLSIGKVSIENGRVTVSSTSGGRPQVYDNINFTATDLSGSSAFPFTLDMKTAGGGKLKVDGKAGPMAADSSDTPLEATVKAEGVDLASLGAFDPNAGMSGKLDYNGSIHSDGTQLRSQGTVKTQQLKLVKSGAPARSPITIDYVADYDMRRQAGALTKGDIFAGKAPAKLTGTFSTRGETPSVHMNLSAQNAPVQELEGALPAFGVVLPQGSSLQGGTISTNLTIEGPLDRLVTTGPVRIAGSKLAGFNLGSKLSAIGPLAGIKTGSDTMIQDLSSSLRVAPDGIRADAINLIVEGMGAVTGNGTISANNALNFHMLAKLTGGGGALGQLSSIAGIGLGQAAQKNGIPFMIQGTTSNPVFVPDVGGMVKNFGASQLQPQQQQQGLGGILGGLFGNKKKK